MAYGYSVKNNTAVTQTYTFSTGESIVPPVGTPAQVYADVSYTLANTDGSATLAPVGSAVQSFMLSADGGMTFSNAGVDVGNAVTANTKGSSSWGPYSATAPSPGGTWNYMQIVSRFTLTPYKDVATISGTASITPIPEPESYAMLLAGLGMVGFMARRRRVL
jgi:hypothetical protein